MITISMLLVVLALVLVILAMIGKVPLTYAVLLLVLERLIAVTVVVAR